jgi:hypothetical protein
MTPDHGLPEPDRRLDLVQSRFLRQPLRCGSQSSPASVDDPEREAIMGEEAAPMMPVEAHNATVAALLRAASPLAGAPGAVACRSCGRGVWCSPSWRGPQPPDLCAQCWRERAP